MEVSWMGKCLWGDEKRERIMRADVWLVDHQLVESREQAQRLIAKGVVKVESTQKVIKKPSEKVADDVVLICEEQEQYVSRGAYKLIEALDLYLPDATGKIVVDIGASTGGFTDLLRQRGAQKVYAIDSGSNQLHTKLQGDKAIISLENTNARYLKKKDFKPLPNVGVMDVSFISATLIMPTLAEILDGNAFIFILVKPQFEVGREFLGKNGVVHDVDAREMAVQKVVECGKQICKWQHLNTLPSPIQGPQGNYEFIAIFKNSNA